MRSHCMSLRYLPPFQLSCGLLGEDSATRRRGGAGEARRRPAFRFTSSRRFSRVRTPRLPSANLGSGASAGAPSVAQRQLGFGRHSLVLHSNLVPHSNKYLQRYYFMLAFHMTLALHLLRQTAIPEARFRAPLSSLALFHKSENQLSSFQSRAHDFVEMGVSR
jgi:hypothetical protein